MADVMITTDKLTKIYNGKTVVKDVSIQIERGSIVGLVGQNGAGKTTLIRMLTTLVKPTSGSFALLPGRQRDDTTVAAIVERPSIYNNLTGKDNLIAQSKLLGLKADNEYLTYTLTLVGLDASSPKSVKNYSLGMKQRLAIAMTLVGKPELLILDEPTNGLDPQGIYDMREIFVKLNREMGTTILVSSHILSELSKFATDFFIMDKGRVLKHISADEIRNLGGKRVKMTVDKTEEAKKVLEQYGKTEIVSSNEIVLQTESDAPITQIMLSLAQAEITVTNVNQMGDSLEEYYIELLKKEKPTTPPQNFKINGGSL